jgi:hypothetical protein
MPLIPRRLISIAAWAIASAVLLASPAYAGTLVDKLTKVPRASRARYFVHDDRGHTMDCLKVVQNGRHGYLGVYHAYDGSRYHTHLARSNDLLHWSHIVRLATNAHQPTLADDGDAWVLAFEVSRPRGGNFIRVVHYASTAKLRAANHNRSFAVPNRLPDPGSAQGTPNIVSTAGNRIKLGFHYYANGTDRQAKGTLRGFRRWSSKRLPRLDRRFRRLGVAGNIGDRDYFKYGGRSWGIYEGQLVNRDFSTWRIFLRNRSTGTLRRLRIRTARGSTSIANPTVTRVRLPGGKPGIVVTYFIHRSGAGHLESGELVFYQPLRRG